MLAKPELPGLTLPPSSIMRLAMPLALALSYLATLVAGLPKVLIFSRTLGYRHESIPVAIDALKSHGPGANIQFDATEDPSHFTNSNLAQYDAILFLMTTDSNDTTRVEILDADQKVCLPLRCEMALNATSNHVVVRVLAVFGSRGKLYWHPQRL